MPKKPDERIGQAKELFLKGMKLVDISRQLDLPEGTVRRWKSTHKWDNERSDNKANVRKRGGQRGNKNASGPPKNNNAEKHGLFWKYLPEETFSIIEEMPTDPLDVLWDQIQISYVAIIRAQQIMYVSDRQDKTVEKVSSLLSNIMLNELDKELECRGHRFVRYADDCMIFCKSKKSAQRTLENILPYPPKIIRHSRHS